MKKPLLILILAFSASFAARSQVPDTVSMMMENISIPTSPGFILLDQSPTLIDRPSSPKAFAANIYNAYMQTGGFPSNYGVEFTPFWFFRHPKMTSYKYLGYDKENSRQMPFSHIKKASLTIAYVNQPDTLSRAGISNIAFGVRTTLVSFRSKKNLEAIQKANDKVVMNLRSLNQKIIAIDFLDENYREKVQAIIDNYENDPDLLESEAELRQQIEVRPVFAIDAAFAYSTFFLDNSFSKQHFGRLGVWTILNYSQSLGRTPASKSYVNIYGIFRYMQDGMSADSTGSYVRASNFDFGAKAELEWNRLVLSVEYILRSREDVTGSNYRAVGSLNYRLSKSFALTASFGRNFGQEQNLVSLFGLNFGLNSGNETATVKE